MQTNPSISASRSPVQERSRASTDRMLASATSLFVEGGYDAVTAAEVARRAQVAVGTIYGRFGNKDGLVHAVQGALLARFEVALIACETSPEWTETPPETLISTLILSLAALLADQAPALQPVMHHASIDAATAELGKAGFARLRLAFLQAATRAEPLIHRDDPAGAIESCFSIAYATFARALGLGSSPEAADAASVPGLAADLGAMCEAFLFRMPA